ncbi:hypothetical protein M0802_015942 [Mischocyttarus mexicanus]|nr:hypothetical protein M0802_015942 [Mischocyttarus mexicanus]
MPAKTNLEEHIDVRFGVKSMISTNQFHVSEQHSDRALWKRRDVMRRSFLFYKELSGRSTLPTLDRSICEMMMSAFAPRAKCPPIRGGSDNEGNEDMKSH